VDNDDNDDKDDNNDNDYIDDNDDYDDDDDDNDNDNDDNDDNDHDHDLLDDWSPVMSSSPEATMLDNSELVLSPEKGSRPLQNLSEASIEEQDLSSERRPE